MANELTRAWRHIYNLLKADVELMALVDYRVHRGAVPAGGQMPAIIYAMLAPGTNLTALGGDRVWADMVFKVAAAGQTADGLDLEPIADGIDRALHNTSGPVMDSTGYVFTCMALRPFELIDNTGPVEFQQLGGEYAITLRAT